MKIFIVILVFIQVVCHSADAQPGMHRREKMEMIHSAKMAYIADRLRLTETQSISFTPIYNEYESEVRDTRREYMAHYKDIHPNEGDDTMSKQYVDDNLDYQEKVIGIKRKYNERFLKVLSPQQLEELPGAEREFKKILLRQMERKRMDMDRGGPGYPRGGRGF